MKMLKSALLMICIVLAINSYLNIHTSACLETLHTHTQNALEALSQEDFAEANKEYNAFIDELNNEKQILKLQLPHEMIEEVELEAATLYHMLQWEETKEATIALETIKQKLTFIDQAQKLNLHNLF